MRMFWGKFLIELIRFKLKSLKCKDLYLSCLAENSKETLVNNHDFIQGLFVLIIFCVTDFVI